MLIATVVVVVVVVAQMIICISNTDLDKQQKSRLERNSIN